MRFAQGFTLPQKLSPLQQVNFCLDVVRKYQNEARYLRRVTARTENLKKRSDKESVVWKQKYQQLKEAYQELKKENSHLKQEVDRLTKTNQRYQISLFDHGNFKHQQEGLAKKPKGGQIDHADTNRENQSVGVSSEDFNYDHFPRKRIYAKVCSCCGTALTRVTAFKQKILLDIILNPQIVKLVIESERQWCGRCHQEVVAKDPQTLPFSEYGLNTLILLLILRFKGHLSLGSISSVYGVAFGLNITKSDISNLLKSAASYLGPKYQELLEAVRRGEVVYADETGWRVKGTSAWMWIMAASDTKEQSGVTVYLAAESRGKGVAEELYGDCQSPCMTDGLGSYLKVIPSEKHLYCWAHLLRFSFEETVGSNKSSPAIFLRDELVRIYHFKFDHPEYSKSKLEDMLREEVDKLLSLTSDEQSFLKIQHRLKEQKEGLILALLLTKDGTNNLAERELRPMVLNKTVSFGSDTYSGMEVSAKLGSVIQTLSRQKADLLTELNLNLQIGIYQKYPQYQHLAYPDSS